MPNTPRGSANVNAIQRANPARLNSPAAAPGVPPAYRFVALVGAEPVAWSDTLPGILCDLEAIHESGLGEDVALWQDGKRLLAVVTDEGRLCWLREVRPA